MIDRRAFLLGASAMALPAARLVAASAPIREPARIDGVGVQLYTVRDLMRADPGRTLDAIAGMGVTEVELHDLYGMTPRAFKAMLDAAGLRAVSGHVGLDAVRSSWSATLETAAELGQRLIVVPSLPGSVRTRAGLQEVADEFNRAGTAANRLGLRFGYHNHEWEFQALDGGGVPMDILLDRSDPSLVDWQMDIFWTVHGGADPDVELQRRAGRVTSVHVKDRTASGEMVDVGQGVIDFGSILDSADEQGLLHAFVEHDSPEDALLSLSRGVEHVSELRTDSAGGRGSHRPDSGLLR